MTMAVADDARGLAYPDQRAILTPIGFLDFRGKRTSLADQLLTQKAAGGGSYFGVAQVENVGALQRLAGRPSMRANFSLTRSIRPSGLIWAIPMAAW